MIDRLRMLLNRPLRDGERRRLFVIAVVVIITGAGALALVDRPGPQSQRMRDAPSTASPLVRPPTVPADDGVSLDAPSEEGNPRHELSGSRSDVAASKRAARRFLSGYLPYSYGRRSARRISSASPDLRRRLAAQRPRVTGNAGRRRARVMLVQSNGVGPVRAELVALVRDGARHYTVPLEVVRSRDGWQVTAVGS